MPSPNQEFERLKKTKHLISSRLPGLGINKRQEIIRLLYEISKREDIQPARVFPATYPKQFSQFKQYLLKRRLPRAYLHNEISKPYLPKLELDPADSPNLRKRKFYPNQIIIEKSVQSSFLARQFRKAFPRTVFKEIESLKGYLQKTRKFTIADYNNRRDIVFIIKERYDFFKPCPCTQGATGCGYHIFNLGLGCIFECTYCYLQEYVNSPGIILPANIDLFFNAFTAYKRPGMRIGTGEFSDSLMLDHITEYSRSLIDFFSRHTEVTFEFKTKSNRTVNLLKARHNGNIVVSWSLNPQRIIDENEFLTTSLKERLDAAARCVEAGYRVGFHFDPVFCFSGWEREYGRVLELVFNKIKTRHIAWLSLGTLRFKPPLKKIIEARFPQNKILDEELLLGYDNKLRYTYNLRYNIYKSLLRMMRQHAKHLPVYLCMEEKSMWRALNQNGSGRALKPQLINPG